MSPQRASQRGFTLVELMVSMVLFAIAIAGVLSVAVSMTQGFREQRQVVATESSVRSPMQFMADAIRGASPAVPSGNIQDVATCTTGAVTVVNSASAPDQLDVVFAEGGVVTSLRSTYDGTTNATITVTDPTQILVGDTLLLTNSLQGHLVHVTAVNTATGVLTIDTPTCAVSLPAGGYPPSSLVIRAVRGRFSISAVDGIPCLMFDPDAGGPAVAEPLAENVEDMQIAVGVDVNANGGVDTNEWEYDGTTGVLAGTIRAIRVTLVARAQNQLQAATAAFFRPRAEDRPVATTLDSYRRRVLTSTIEVRNFTGSP